MTRGWHKSCSAHDSGVPVGGVSASTNLNPGGCLARLVRLSEVASCPNLSQSISSPLLTFSEKSNEIHHHWYPSVPSGIATNAR